MAAVEAGSGLGEGESAGERGRVDAEQTRSLGAVQVQATGFVAFVDTEGDDGDAGKVSGVQAERVAACRGC